MSFVQKSEAVGSQSLYSRSPPCSLLEHNKTQEEDEEMQASTGGRWCSVKPRLN